MEWQQQGYCISTDKTALDIEVIYQYLSEEAYWCKGVPQATVKTAIDNSLCFGLYQQGKTNWLCQNDHRLCHVCVFVRCLYSA